MPEPAQLARLLARDAHSRRGGAARSPSAPPRCARTSSRWTRSPGRRSGRQDRRAPRGVARWRCAPGTARSDHPVSCGGDRRRRRRSGPRARAGDRARSTGIRRSTSCSAPAAKALLRVALSAVHARSLVRMRAAADDQQPVRGRAAMRGPCTTCRFGTLMALACRRRRLSRDRGVAAGRADARRARPAADARDADVHAGALPARRPRRSRVAAGAARDLRRSDAVGRHVAATRSRSASSRWPTSRWPARAIAFDGVP